MSSATGGCLCGTIRYEAFGPGNHATLCHCSSCRRASGAPLVAWVTFGRTDFRFTTSPPTSFESSTGVTRTFCPKCGSPLTYARDDLADEIDVTLATLDHPETMPPADHTWDDERLPWLESGDSLPRFRRSRGES